MAEITIEVCDMCMNPARTATTWTITAPGVRKELALCDEHAEPLHELIEGGPRVNKPAAKRPAKKAAAKKAPAKRTARARARTSPSRIVTLEEIEAAKAKGGA